jgi:hypothetical protein
MGTASLPYVTLPAALSDNINQNMRTVADSKIRSLTSLLIFGICRIMEGNRSRASFAIPAIVALNVQPQMKQIFSAKLSSSIPASDSVRARS